LQKIKLQYSAEAQASCLHHFPLEMKKQIDVSPTSYNVRQSMTGPGPVSHTEAPEKVIRGGVNESQSKFFKGT
jgi:hypothetical protein